MNLKESLQIKPILFLDEILYPKSLTEIMRELSKEENEWSIIHYFEKNALVRVISIMGINEEENENIIMQIRDEIFRNSSPGVILLDGTELKESIREINNMLNNGISEKIFIDWFTLLMMQLSQFANCDEEGNKKEGRVGGAISVCDKRTIINNEIEETYYFSHLIISSDGLFLAKPLVNEILDRANKRIRNKVNKKSKNDNNKRKPIDSRLRHECFKRDGYRCVECGATNKETTLHADHILAVTQGGTDELDNLQTLCCVCNFIKYNKCYFGGITIERIKEMIQDKKIDVNKSFIEQSVTEECVKDDNTETTTKS